MKIWVRSLLLWFLAILVTLLCIVFQDKTGPTYPLDGSFEATNGTINYKFLRSETIGKDLSIMIIDPVPTDIEAYVKFRRYKSDDDWSSVKMMPGEFKYVRRGKTKVVEGLGAELPSLQKRAGKYEYFVYFKDGDKEAVSITGKQPILARYKAKVPLWALAIHIFIIFASMALAIRTVLEAMVNGKFKWMIWSTIISLLLGGFVFGPVVQWYAFGVWWSGIPFGYDWTDNKVLVSLAFWLIALILNWGKRRNRWSIYIAGLVTLIVYFIPHSIFGSEFDYRLGSGMGTAD